MKPNQLIQVCQHIDGVHWIYARVLQQSDEGVLVRIDHPGNPEHDQQKVVRWEDCRTGDDVQKILDLARDTYKQKGKAEHASRAVADLDPWIAYALTPSEKGPAIGHEGLHKMHGNGKPGIVVHYEAQLARLGGAKK